MPDFHLTVCGPIHKEKSFEELYKKELYETPNIHTKGFIDINSDEFSELANNCVALIFPTSAELSCGGVITCMHAGIIPICTPESGVDIDDFGLLLQNFSIDHIKESVTRISELSASQLEEMTRKAWETAQSEYTRENFTIDYHKAINQILT